MIKQLELVQEQSILLESMDSPYEKSLITDRKYDHIKLGEKGISDYKDYALHVPNTKERHELTTFKRNGAYEIHHSVDNISGEWKTSSKPNPRYVATMLHHTKELLDSGHKVRVVGHVASKMFDRYHRLSNILAKRHGYTVSDPKTYEYPSPSSIDYNEITVSKKDVVESSTLSITISPRCKNLILGDIREINQNLKTPSNNYLWT